MCVCVYVCVGLSRAIEWTVRCHRFEAAKLAARQVCMYIYRAWERNIACSIHGGHEIGRSSSATPMRAITADPASDSAAHAWTKQGCPCANRRIQKSESVLVHLGMAQKP